ncbi:Crp/Fnr family transcriptional regulator [Sulfurovum sp.]|uniref:Crp/Fnr family transcriptional regulator n=1 Tax=Sulfurovum sp. TaxID=1969726 RepID=UPI0025D7D7EC|nr:Crp/Fnr family transcriptional regulator [Sulfurovum sp.]
MGNEEHQNDMIQKLKNAVFFEGMGDDFFEMAASHFQEVRMKKSDDIDSAETLKYFYIIDEGSVKIIHVDPESGRSIAPFLLSSHEAFDILPIIDGKENMADYIAVEKSVLLKTEAHFIREWVNEYPQITINLLQCLSKKLRELENFSESIVFYDTKTRLSNLILKYAFKEKKRLKESKIIQVAQKFSHETLAEMIGSVRSVVTTQLQELKRDGVILDKHAEIMIKDLEQLKDRCAKYIDL